MVTYEQNWKPPKVFKCWGKGIISAQIGVGAQAWLDQNWSDFWNLFLFPFPNILKEVEGGGGNLTCHGDCNQESCPQIQGPSFGPKIQIQIQTEKHLFRWSRVHHSRSLAHSGLPLYFCPFLMLIVKVFKRPLPWFIIISDTRNRKSSRRVHW